MSAKLKFIRKSAMLAMAFAIFLPCTLQAAVSGKDLLNVNIPQIYGKKGKEVFKGSNEKTIIHIQDAHGNLEAKENTHAIIKNLVSQGVIDGVAEEGSEGEWDTSAFESVSPSDARLVVDFMSKYDQIPASIRYKALDNQDMPVVGAEDMTIHAANKAAMLEAFGHKKEKIAKARKIASVMEALKRKIYDADTLQFLQTLEDFKEDKVTLTTYAKALKEKAESANIAWANYHHFNKVIESVNLESKIDFAKIDRERLDLTDAIETKTGKDKSDTLVTKSLNYRLGRLSASEYYNFLTDEAKNAGLDLSQYPNVENYARLVNIYAEINEDVLFDETDRLEVEVKGKVLSEGAQLQFDHHAENLNILMKMVSLEMTQKDLAFYKEKRSKVSETIAFIKEQAKANGLDINLQESLSSLDKNLDVNEKFYDLATKRDTALVEQTLAMMDERGWNTVVLVAGGYHSKGIAKQLKAKAISHMILTPRITNPDAPNYYLAKMTGEKTEYSELVENFKANALQDNQQTQDQLKKDDASDFVAYTAEFLKARAEGKTAGRVDTLFDQVLAENPVSSLSDENFMSEETKNAFPGYELALKAIQEGFPGVNVNIVDVNQPNFVESDGQGFEKSFPIFFKDGQLYITQTLAKAATEKPVAEYLKALATIEQANRGKSEEAIFEAQRQAPVSLHLKTIMLASLSQKGVAMTDTQNLALLLNYADSLFTTDAKGNEVVNQEALTDLGLVSPDMLTDVDLSDVPSIVNALDLFKDSNSVSADALQGSAEILAALGNAIAFRITDLSPVTKEIAEVTDLEKGSLDQHASTIWGVNFQELTEANVVDIDKSVYSTDGGHLLGIRSAVLAGQNIAVMDPVEDADTAEKYAKILQKHLQGLTKSPIVVKHFDSAEAAAQEKAVAGEKLLPLIYNVSKDKVGETTTKFTSKILKVDSAKAVQQGFVVVNPRSELSVDTKFTGKVRAVVPEVNGSYAEGLKIVRLANTPNPGAEMGKYYDNLKEKGLVSEGKEGREDLVKEFSKFADFSQGVSQFVFQRFVSAKATFQAIGKFAKALIYA